MRHCRWQQHPGQLQDAAASFLSFSLLLPFPLGGERGANAEKNRIISHIQAIYALVGRGRAHTCLPSFFSGEHVSHT